MRTEIRILDWIQSLHTPVTDILMCFVTKLGNAGMIWILLAAILIFIPKKRRSGAILAVALCVEVLLCNGILKNLFCRIRPCDINMSIQLLIARPDDFSFPSGHTASSFAAVAALYLAREKRLWKLALVLAVLIGFSRMYLYVHYPTDIVGGVIVGIAAGYIGYRIIKKLQKMKDDCLKNI